VGVPTLAVIAGHPALPEALRAAWPRLRIQRCTVHKLRNLLAKAPCRLHDELTEDYRRMVYAAAADAVQTQRRAFRTKRRRLCRGFVESLDEAGDDLFTFLAFPRSPWKALRTTNALERINEEFRRRTTTQAMLPSEDAVLVLLFGLFHSGAITAAGRATPDHRLVQRQLDRSLSRRRQREAQKARCVVEENVALLLLREELRLQDRLDPRAQFCRSSIGAEHDTRGIPRLHDAP